MTDDHTYGRVNAVHAAKLQRPVETHVSKKETLSSKPVQVSLVNQLETLAAEIENINPLSSRIDALNELAWRWRYREKEQALQQFPFWVIRREDGKYFRKHCRLCGV